MPQRPAGATDRAAGVAADGQRRHPRGHGGGRAAAGAAGHARQVPGIVGGEEGRVLVRPAHGELVHVGPADQHGVGRLQPGDDRGVVGRAEVRQHPRGAGGRLALRAEHVLDGHRQPGQRPQRLAGLAAAVDRFGLGQGRGGIGACRPGGDGRFVRPGPGPPPDPPAERPHRPIVPLDAVQAAQPVSSTEVTSPAQLRTNCVALRSSMLAFSFQLSVFSRDVPACLSVTSFRHV